jgi:hypothetical protein
MIRVFRSRPVALSIEPCVVAFPEPMSEALARIHGAKARVIVRVDPTWHSDELVAPSRLHHEQRDQPAILARVEPSFPIGTTLRYVTFRYVTLRYVTLRYVTLRYVTLRYVTLR